ncbi:MAG TPA: fibronectin type III domain-containing protein [Solirubrobacteraceae bacterium]|nr:fibronectin type III domain-containing protein [Solirubrobacteraceae bacterium]
MNVRSVVLAAVTALCASAGGPLALGSAPAWAAAPAIRGESSSSPGSSSVTLSAQVDPEGSPGSYFFEYGPSEAYGSVTPAESLGGGSEAVGAQTVVSGLQPGTLYHYRVVATNENGETARGTDETFTTYPASISGLPDGRVYELVTPESPGDLIALEPHEYYAGGGIAKYSEDFGEMSTKYAFRAAADGGALAYLGTASAEGGYGTDGEDGDAYLARRSATGWTSSLIQPKTGREASYEFLSSDLSEGVFTEHSVGKKYANLFMSDLSTGEDEPIFDGAALGREADEFGTYGDAIADAGETAGLLFAGASADMSQKLFEANGALDGQAEEAPPSEEQNDLYDSYGGQLYLVNVLPNGRVDPGATFGGMLTKLGEGTGNGSFDFRNVISSDGSRIFWSAVEVTGVTYGRPIFKTTALYMRVNDTQPQSPLNGEGRCIVAADGCTVQIDASQGPGASGGGQFWDATADGSRVFFTDCNHLTGQYSTEPEGCGDGDLYEYDVESGRLTDLTVDANASDAHGANVQGVVGISEDGSYVYFVATGVLASGATAGQDNLYALHVGEPVRFVATLSEEADALGEDGGPPGDWRPAVGEDAAQVTPDGRHLVYTATAGTEQEEIRQIYMYDFGREKPYCISCSPVSAREDHERTMLPVSYSATYASRVMSNDGDRVFFETGLPLVPQDTSGRMNVYEWERDGSGSCAVEKGCVYLLSGGSGDTDSRFVEASEDGDDVFMVTRSELGPQPQGEAPHIVDAHVGMSLAPPECTGAGCQGVPEAPPIFATPSSVTFEGVGNFTAGSQRTTTVAPKTKRKTKTRRRGRRKSKTKRRGGRKAGKRAKAKVGGRAKRAGARRAARAGMLGKAER